MGSVGVKLLRELVWGCRSHEWGALSLHVGRGDHPSVPAPPPPRLSAPSPERWGRLRLAEGCVGPRSEMGRPGVGGPREGRSVGLGMVSIPTWESVVSVSQSCLTAGGLNLAFILFWLGCESEVKGWEGPHCLPRPPRRLLPASVSFLHFARTCVASCMQPSWLRSFSPTRGTLFGIYLRSLWLFPVPSPHPSALLRCAWACWWQPGSLRTPGFPP